MPAATGTKPLKKLKPGMGLYQVMHMPSKAPEKSKPWAIVNLETGDINGRWHRSREEALAQARAMYASMGDKAKVHSEEVHNAFFLFADASTLVSSDDGVKWIEAIAPKTYSTPMYGDVEITPDTITAFATGINTRVRGQDIAINYEHGVDPTKGLKAAGWIKSARVNDGGNLELAVDFTEPAKQEIRNGEWKYFSLEWDDEWLHPDGLIYTDVVMGGALTNRPVAKGLMPINFSEIFKEMSDEELAKSLSDDNPEYEFAVWSTAYVNSLPDSSFLWVDPDGNRHLPYKDRNGKVDLPHLRNAAARLNQVKGMSDAVAARIRSKIDKLLGTKNASELATIDEQIVAEEKEREHSEPGTGQPPVPRESEETHDPDREGGWRRDTPPIVRELEDIKKFAESDAMNYLDGAAKALNQYINAEPDYYDKACANDLISRIYNMQGRIQTNVNAGVDMPMAGMMSEMTSLATEAFEELNKIHADRTEKLKESGVVVKFSEAEAVGYLTSAITGLRRIHTNKGDNFIERIERILAVPQASRSFNELTRLTNEVRTYLRSNNGANSSSTSDASEGGYTVGELTERDLRELRTILDVEDDAKIVEGVKVKFGELAALRDAVSASEQERVFAEQYPQFYSEHRKLVAENRRNGAKSFSESVQKVRKAEGFGLKTTSQGLSTSALEKLEEVHMKFAEGVPTVEDFEEAVKAIMHGGIVQFGEIGGSNGSDELPEVDLRAPTGVAEARKLFAEVVGKIQRENPDMDYITAVQEAAKKHPDLGEAYKITLPA